jgi:valyl-tRNA synthetase
MKPKDAIKLSIHSDNHKGYKLVTDILAKQVNADEVAFVSDIVANSITTVVGKDKFYIQSEIAVDASVQKEQLLKELEYQKGFLVAVSKKLSNERFVQNAKPEIVENERKKKSDAEQKIKAIEESLIALGVG